MKLKQLIMESNITWKKLSDAEARDVETSTGRLGTLVATFDEIVEIVGPPSRTWRSKSSETKAEWIFKGSNGAWCCIYDYKTNTHYNDNDIPPMDMSGLSDDPEMQKKIKERQQKKFAELKKTQAYKLGLHKVKEWSISGGFDDVMAVNMSRKRPPANATLDLAHAIFGDRVHASTFGLEFERLVGQNPQPYIPSHLRKTDGNN